MEFLYHKHHTHGVDGQFTTGKGVQRQPCKGKSNVSLRNDFYQTAWPQWSVWPDPNNVSNLSYHDLLNYDF